MPGSALNAKTESLRQQMVHECVTLCYRSVNSAQIPIFRHFPLETPDFLGIPETILNFP
jgi:hypothetical protein